MQFTEPIILLITGVIFGLASVFEDPIVIYRITIPPLRKRSLRLGARIVSVSLIMLALAIKLGFIKTLLPSNASQASAASMQPPTNGISAAQLSRTKKSATSNTSLSGQWIDDKGMIYTIVQEGESVYWSSEGRGPIKSMRAEGTLHGNTLSMITETNDNSTGHAEMTVSAAYDELIGMLDDSKHGKGAMRLRRR